MARPPRSTSAATERLSIRVTEPESAALQALASKLGLSSADYVRGLIERERQAHDYVDARPSSRAAGRFSAPNLPRHVYTLHILPGRAEAVCVRRAVHESTDTTSFEFARGREAYVNTDELLGNGHAETCGDSRCVDTMDGEWRQLDGVMYYDLGPRLTVFLSPPTPAQRQAWTARRHRAQALLRRVLREGRLMLWEVQLAPGLDAPALKRHRRAARRPRTQEESIERRGDLLIEIPGAKYGDGWVNLHEIAADGWAWGRDQVFYGWGTACFAYSTEEPSPETLAAIGCSQRARDAYQRRVNEEEARVRKATEDAAGRARAAFVPESVIAALVDLGLSWPCTVDGVSKAQRTAAKTHHPDKGGDEVRMRRINQAADVVRQHLERPMPSVRFG